MRAHLVGIGGVGMAGLAVLLKRRGHAVTGCDLKSTARTRWLESQGIPVAIGHDAKHVDGQDLVIVTPAVAKDNSEYLAAKNILCRGSALARLVSDAPDSIAVCGSHGKTTTATFIAKLLIALGEPVEWAIGGETGDFPVAGYADAPFCACPHAQQGGANVLAPRAPEGRRTTEGSPIDSPVLVVEADESDGTLAEYAAKTLVVTNCDYDHPDHFKTRADYIACYDAARAKAREVVDADLLSASIGEATSSSLRGRAFHAETQSRGAIGEATSSSLRGLAPHNRRNALMAVEVARRRGHSMEAIVKVLPQVVAELPDRRFQRVWPTGEVVRRETRDASGDATREAQDEVSRLASDSSRLPSPDSRPQPSQSPQPLFSVYADYGHHPTEIRSAIQMARAVAKGRVIVLFQPHRHSRTAAFRREFASALALADEVVLCPTYAAFERPVEGGDVADLYAACRECFHAETQSRGALGEATSASTRLHLARSCAEAWEHARNTMRPDDLTLLLGAGDIIDLVPEIQRSMTSVRVRSDLNRTDVEDGSGSLTSDEDVASPNVRRIWIGAGSNTWKSDLTLDVEYVKTAGPAGRPGAALLADPAIGPRIPWMAGIPGTIGGWIKMNAGAFGHSISEAIESVKVDGKWLSASACGFSYRHSDIAGEIQDVRFIGKATPASHDQETKPSAVDLDLQPRPSSAVVLQSRPEDYLARRKKFPPGTKGSVFKNPPGDFAGRLLEVAGVKGLRVGGAYVWEEHANVIVAGPDATPSDFLALARLMAARVRLRFGVALEPEVAGLIVD